MIILLPVQWSHSSVQENQGRTSLGAQSNWGNRYLTLLGFTCTSDNAKGVWSSQAGPHEIFWPGWNKRCWALINSVCWQPWQGIPSLPMRYGEVVLFHLIQPGLRVGFVSLEASGVETKAKFSKRLPCSGRLKRSQLTERFRCNTNV